MRSGLLFVYFAAKLTLFFIVFFLISGSVIFLSRVFAETMFRPTIICTSVSSRELKSGEQEKYCDQINNIVLVFTITVSGIVSIFWINKQLMNKK